MINLNDYVLIADIWEADVVLDLPVLWQNGIRGFAIRQNDINGYLHMDTQFTYHWNTISAFISPEGKKFVQFPYYVYSPWYNGKENEQYERSHFPPNCKVAADDVEVVNPNKNSTKYAQEFDGFVNLNADLSQLIYTGQWFINSLAYWPTSKLYWWAAYPWVVYPSSRINISWDDFKNIISKKLNWVDNWAKAPGKIAMWQFTADRLILPGCGGRCIDFNLMPNVYFNILFSQTPQPIPLPEFIPYIIMIISPIGLNVRTGAGTTYSKITALPFTKKVTVLEEKNGWGRIQEVDNGWINLIYTKKV